MAKKKTKKVTTKKKAKVKKSLKASKPKRKKTAKRTTKPISTKAATEREGLALVGTHEDVSDQMSFDEMSEDMEDEQDTTLIG